MFVLEIITLVSSLIALCIAAYLFWKSDRTLTLEEFQELYKKGESLAVELEKVGLMAVSAVEQLKETGKINTNEEAFNEAFDYICAWPGMDQLDRKIIARAVEGSYHMYKLVAEVRNVKEQTQTTQRIDAIGGPYPNG